ncbi:unnamed protein product, partial [Prorocentrum cordatum]
MIAKYSDAEYQPGLAGKVTNVLIELGWGIQDLLALLEPKSEQLLMIVVDIVMVAVYREEDDDVEEQPVEIVAEQVELPNSLAEVPYGYDRGHGGSDVDKVGLALASGSAAGAGGQAYDAGLYISSIAEAPGGRDDRGHGGSDVDKADPGQAYDAGPCGSSIAEALGGRDDRGHGGSDIDKARPAMASGSAAGAGAGVQQRRRPRQIRRPVSGGGRVGDVPTLGSSTSSTWQACGHAAAAGRACPGQAYDAGRYDSSIAEAPGGRDDHGHSGSDVYKVRPAMASGSAAGAGAGVQQRRRPRQDRRPVSGGGRVGEVPTLGSSTSAARQARGDAAAASKADPGQAYDAGLYGSSIAEAPGGRDDRGHGGSDIDKVRPAMASGSAAGAGAGVQQRRRPRQIRHPVSGGGRVGEVPTLGSSTSSVWQACGHAAAASRAYPGQAYDAGRYDSSIAEAPGGRDDRGRSGSDVYKVFEGSPDGHADNSLDGRLVVGTDGCSRSSIEKVPDCCAYGCSGIRSDEVADSSADCADISADKVSTCRADGRSDSTVTEVTDGCAYGYPEGRGDRVSTHRVDRRADDGIVRVFDGQASVRRAGSRDDSGLAEAPGGYDDGHVGGNVGGVSQCCADSRGDISIDGWPDGYVRGRADGIADKVSGRCADGSPDTLPDEACCGPSSGLASNSTDGVCTRDAGGRADSSVTEGTDDCAGSDPDSRGDKVSACWVDGRADRGVVKVCNDPAVGHADRNVGRASMRRAGGRDDNVLVEASDGHDDSRAGGSIGGTPDSCADSRADVGIDEGFDGYGDGHADCVADGVPACCADGGSDVSPRPATRHYGSQQHRPHGGDDVYGGAEGAGHEDPDEHKYRDGDVCDGELHDDECDGLEGADHGDHSKHEYRHYGECDSEQRPPLRGMTPSRAGARLAPSLWFRKAEPAAGQDQRRAAPNGAAIVAKVEKGVGVERAGQDTALEQDPLPNFGGAEPAQRQQDRERYQEGEKLRHQSGPQRSWWQEALVLGGALGGPREALVEAARAPSASLLDGVHDGLEAPAEATRAFADDGPHSSPAKAAREAPEKTEM